MWKNNKNICWTEALVQRAVCIRSSAFIWCPRCSPALQGRQTGKAEVVTRQLVAPRVAIQGSVRAVCPGCVAGSIVREGRVSDTRAFSRRTPGRRGRPTLNS